jgi:hypothetical protein
VPGGVGSGAAFRFGLDARKRGTDRSFPGPGDLAAHHCPAIPKSVPSSPEYSNAVTLWRSVSVNSSATCGTGPRTSRKQTRCGRSKVTVSSVVAVSRPP